MMKQLETLDVRDKVLVIYSDEISQETITAVRKGFKDRDAGVLAILCLPEDSCAEVLELDKAIEYLQQLKKDQEATDGKSIKTT
jgi:hypothetical protein